MAQSAQTTGIEPKQDEMVPYGRENLFRLWGVLVLVYDLNPFLPNVPF